MAGMMALSEFVSAFSTIAVAMNDASAYEPVLGQVGRLVHRRVDEKIGHYQVHWPTSPFGPYGAESPATIARKGFDEPLIDTGEFQEDIHHEVHSPSVDIFTNAEGAKYTEYGTVNMIPRPVFYPSVQEQREEIELLIGAAAVEMLSGGRPLLSNITKARLLLPAP